MLKSIFSLPADLYKNRRLVMKLAKNDFKTRYAGSYFGTFWAFVQPVVTILVYWFVFSVGFRSNTDELGVPFVLYLVAGIVPWFFFSDALCNCPVPLQFCTSSNMSHEPLPSLFAEYISIHNCFSPIYRTSAK